MLLGINLLLLLKVNAARHKLTTAVKMDGKKIIVTEASVRRDLQLNDEEVPSDPQHTSIIIQPSTSQPQKKQISRRPKIKDIKVPQPSGSTTNVTDEAVNEEMDDSLERAATTATSLEAEQDSGNIDKTQSKATLNEPSSLGTSSGSGPRRQDTIGDTIAQTRFENMSKTSNDSLLAGHTNVTKINEFEAPAHIFPQSVCGAANNERLIHRN
ncbi:hypothetical protein Tco_0010608 [Tanacetum coccineum]